MTARKGGNSDLENIELHLKNKKRENIITLSDAALCLLIISMNKTRQNTKFYSVWGQEYKNLAS